MGWLAARPSPPERMTQHITSRSFTDSVGVNWTVREIGTPTLTRTLEKLLEKERRRSGWLVFESSEETSAGSRPIRPTGARCRRSRSERWCMKATRVPPAPARRAED
jgi:hypothetical protein